MFFFDDTMTRRQISDISSISAGRLEQRGKNDRLVHDITMKDGTILPVLDVSVTEISRSSAMTFAAQAGLSVIVVTDDDGETLVTPVLGWAFTFDGKTLPITHDGVNDDPDAFLPIIFPDGRVLETSCNWHSSVGAYLSSKSNSD